MSNKNTQSKISPIPKGSPADLILQKNPDVLKNLNTKKGRVRQALGGLAAAGVVVLGIVGAAELTKDSSPQKVAEKIEADVAREASNQQLELAEDIVVLNQGAKLRETPARYVYNPDSMQKDRNVSNVAFEVGENEHVVISNALVWNDEEGDTWYGFRFQGPNEDEPSFRWINKSALLNDSVKENGESVDEFGSPISIYNKSETPQTIGYTAVLDEQGQLKSILGPDNNDIATATFVEDGQLEPLLTQIGVADN